MSVKQADLCDVEATQHIAIKAVTLLASWSKSNHIQMEGDMIYCLKNYANRHQYLQVHCVPTVCMISCPWL